MLKKKYLMFMDVFVKNQWAQSSLCERFLFRVELALIQAFINSFGKTFVPKYIESNGR